jgi:hypothetical protein
MSNLSPKRMKWHFRDSRYKISREGCPWTPYVVSRYRRSSALFKILPLPLVSPSGPPVYTIIYYYYYTIYLYTVKSTVVTRKTIN